MSLYLRRRKRFLKKFFVGVSLFFLGSLIFLLVSALGRYFERPDLFTHPFFFILIMTLVAILAYKQLDILFVKFFKNYLFKKKSSAHGMLMALADDLVTVLDITEFSNLVVNTFGEVLHLKTVALLTPSALKGNFEIASAFGWNLSDAKRVKLSEKSPLVELIKTSGIEVLVRDKMVKTVSWQEANQIVHDFNSLRASWILPLIVENDVQGMLAFAAPSPESMFDDADFQLFREFGKRVAKNLKNALTYSRNMEENAQLKDLQSELAQNTKIAAIEQLATGIAHQIHNPLTVISGKAQVLLLKKEKYQLDEKVEDVLKTIVKQTTRASDITRKLLMFSQGPGTAKEHLNLEQVLDDTISLISYRTSLENISITKSIGSLVPSFYGNVHEFREIFLNLILNAVQSIGSEGKIHCEISYKPKEEMIEIQVADSGRGIPVEHFSKLFNPFFTTRQDSLGLGLFVTRQIIHRYGGNIRVESSPENGTIFITHLPCQTEDESYGGVNATIPVSEMEMPETPN